MNLLKLNIDFDLSKPVETIQRIKREAINPKYKIDQKLFIAITYIKNGSTEYFKSRIKIKDSKYSPSVNDNVYIIQMLDSTGKFETLITEKDLERIAIDEVIE